VPVDEDQKEDLRRQVTEILNAEPSLHYAVDPSLIGGMVLQVGDRVYDASIAGKLKHMTDNLSRSLRISRRNRDARGEDDKEGTQSP
jgi:F-type H+-transporting ATPase subunit delta